MYRFLPLTVSVETAGGIATPIILRGTPLPARRQQIFSTYSDNQEAVEVSAYIGERKLAKDNVMLSGIKLEGLPKMKKGDPQVEVVFELDQELQLKVSATDKASGKRVFSESGPNKSFSQEKVSEMIRDAEMNREPDGVKLKRIENKNNAERTISRAEQQLINSPSSTNRREIEQLIAATGIALELGDEAEIVTKATELENKLAKTFHDPFDLFRSVFENKPAGAGKSFPSGPVSPAQAKPTFQAKRNISRLALKKSGPTSSNIGKIFGGVSFTPDPNLCFVLMPFSTKFKPVYEDHIRPVLKKQAMNCVRADEMVGLGSITKDIWIGICRARFLVADLTGRNANVFYEVGLAHALGKDVILLMQNMDDVPFDLKALRCIQYEYTPRGMILMEEKLSQVVVELIRSA